MYFTTHQAIRYAMREFSIGLVAVTLIGASGCGTAGNTILRHPPHAYGGVEMDCMAMQGTWSESDKASVPEKVFWTGLIAADIPLCIVGDTLTLPGVILQSGFKNSAWDFGKEEKNP